MFGKLGRALTLYRLYGRCEDAWRRGLEAPVSGTKLFAVIAGIGALCEIVLKVNSGALSWADAAALAVAAVAAVVSQWRQRVAIAKNGSGK